MGTSFYTIPNIVKDDLRSKAAAASDEVILNAISHKYMGRPTTFFFSSTTAASTFSTNIYF